MCNYQLCMNKHDIRNDPSISIYPDDINITAFRAHTVLLHPDAAITSWSYRISRGYTVMGSCQVPCGNRALKLSSTNPTLSLVIFVLLYIYIVKRYMLSEVEIEIVFGSLTGMGFAQVQHIESWLGRKLDLSCYNLNSIGWFMQEFWSNRTSSR